MLGVFLPPPSPRAREFVLPDRKSVLKGFARDVDWDARVKRRQQEDLGVEDEQQPQVHISYLTENNGSGNYRCSRVVYLQFFVARRGPRARTGEARRGGKWMGWGRVVMSTTRHAFAGPPHPAPLRQTQAARSRGCNHEHFVNSLACKQASRPPSHDEPSVAAFRVFRFFRLLVVVVVVVVVVLNCSGSDDGERAVSHPGGALPPVEHRPQPDGALGGRRGLH